MNAFQKVTGAVLVAALAVTMVVLEHKVVTRLDAIAAAQQTAASSSGAPHLLGALPSGNGQTTSAKSMSVVPASDATFTVSAGTAAAGADAVANPTEGRTFADINGFNGSTWDRIRTGQTAASATVTGKLNTLPWAFFNTTPATRTNGLGSILEADATGNLRIVEQFAPGYENNTTNRAQVELTCTNYHQSGTTTGVTIKSGAGQLYSVTIDTPVVSSVLTFFDNTAASGTVLCKNTMPAALLSSGPMDWMGCRGAFSTGLEIVLATGAEEVTVCYR